MTFVTATEFYEYYRGRDRLIFESFNHSLLRPCPFCRGKVILVEDTGGLSEYMGGVAVDCNACRSRVKFNCFRIARFEQPGEKKAFYINRPDFSATLDAWNSRVFNSPPSIDQEGELKKLTEQLAWIHRWVERGIFDIETSPMDALNVIAHAPDAFWKTGTWDVDHLPYANKFYDKFPNARPKNV